MTSKGPKPLFMRREDITTYYKVGTQEATLMVKKLVPVGHYHGDPLYSRTSVESALKKEN